MYVTAVMKERESQWELAELCVLPAESTRLFPSVPQLQSYMASQNGKPLLACVMEDSYSSGVFQFAPEFRPYGPEPQNL